MKDTIKIAHGSCQMIAHRGLSGLERENTLAAFIAAGNRSYFGMETDIRPTTDGQIVIMHDDHTGNVSNSSIYVEKCNYEDLKSLRLNALDGAPREDLCIPLFEDYLRIARSYDKKCIVELKGVFSDENIQKVLDIVKSTYSLEKVIFIAFDLCNLVKIRQILPNQSAQYLVCEMSDDVFHESVRHNLGLDIHFSAITKDWIDKIHAHGLKVNCWTVNEKADAEKLIKLGVDYITSNILE